MKRTWIVLFCVVFALTAVIFAQEPQRFTRSIDVLGSIYTTGSLTFEGATGDANEITLSVADPGADVTVTIPDGADASYALIPNTLTTNDVGVANSIWGISNHLAFEGATADAFEAFITPVDPTVGDSIISLPNTQGLGGGAVVSARCVIDVTDGHDAAVGTSTCTVEIPANSVLINIQVVTTVLWNAGTSTTMIIGDDDTANGWFVATDLQATDLVVGEVFDISNAENWGGLNGAYLVAATGRKGRTTAGVDSGIYYGAASEVIASVTTVGTVPTTGTTYMIVTWSTPTSVASVYAAT